MKRLIALLAVCATLAYSQGATSIMDGTVIDAQGGVVPGAEITVLNVNTGQIFKTATSDKGTWALPSMAAATYRVTVTKAGFKSENVDNVVVNAGVPATVNARLQIGQTSDTIEVTAGAELIQSESAALSSTVQARQIAELPFATRNAVELLVTQPGVSTPTNPRSSSINGLPKSAINITVDGINAQDNLLKSSDGFFSNIYTPVDAVQEITLTTSAGGVDSTGGGAAQIKFITRSGSNDFHGGVFWQNRNTFFNANYYFNNINGQPRDIINLNQGGFHVGGPILRNKLFFFLNYEIYRLPSTFNFTRTVLTPDALNGNFTYKGTDGKINTVNVYDLAAKGNLTLPGAIRPFATTPDPIISSTLQQINKLTSGGNLRSRIPTNNDYNRMDYLYQPHSSEQRDFYTARFDYNITSKSVLSFIYNYNKYLAAPDGLNNVVPIYSGTGTVLGSDLIAGQRSNRFEGVISLRSTLSPRITNEFRAGLSGGTVLFRDTVGDGLFSAWRGYNTIFGNGSSAYLSGVTTTTTPQRRNSPTKSITETLSWVKGSHQLSFGGNFDQVNLFQANTGTVNSVIPSITFGVAAGDPAISGTTDFFTPNLPNASSTDRTNAEYLYAILTGRISGITQGRSLDATGKTYGQNPAIDRDRIREYGLFAQDTWRLRPDLTVSLGLRYEKQLPFQNLTNTYTSVGLAGIYGISGIGHLFQPGVLTGAPPTYNNVSTVGDAYRIPAVWAPSLGIAWQLPAVGGPLSLFTGHHTGAAVLRVGYSLANLREGSAVFTSIWGSNQGLNIDNSVDPSNYPANFGAPGSALFRDPTLPSRPFPATATYPIASCFTCSLNEFDPNLKMGYVQSWNIGYQRELGKDTVVEFRYTGNHGLHEWRQYNLNEVNILENGFLAEFLNASNNLQIARQKTATTSNFANQGLPGQVNLPILTAALAGGLNDATIASNLLLGQAGTLANSIASNVTRLSNLTKAGYPANFFVVNPAVSTGTSNGGAYLLTNDGSSYFNSGQVELRRRLSKGLLVQSSYVWSHSIADGATASSVDVSQPTTLRNKRIDRVPSGFDIRHAIKINEVYELPFGPGRPFLSSVHNVIARKAIEGWQVAGVTRLQSGTPFFFSSFSTFNQFGDGVILHNFTSEELQNMIGNYKSTGPDGKGTVTFLPDSVIYNTKAAFNQGGLTPAQVDPNAKYIGPAAAGTIGQRAFFYRPWQRHIDFALTKKTHITERVTLDFTANALNAFNLTNFLPDSANNNIGSAFGQTTAAYRDTSGTVDPGGRVLEFRFRLDF